MEPETTNDPVQESFERTLTSLTELIIATLRQMTPGRFEEARRLCEIAQMIVQAKAKRTAPQKDAPRQEQNQYGEVNHEQAMVRQAAMQALNNVPVRNDEQMGENMMNPHANVGQLDLVDTEDGRRVPAPRRRPPGQLLFDDAGNLVNEQGIIWAHTPDANALMRHMLMAFGPHAQTGVEANRARVAAEEAAELKTLVALMEGTTDPERAKLDRRVKQLMANMERRSNANPNPQEAPPQLPVVPPDDPRGHPVGEGGPEADAAPRVGADGIGEQGNGGPPPARVVHEVGQGAVVS